MKSRLIAVAIHKRVICGRDVDAVSKDVMGLDDYVADIDAHTESNAPVFNLTDCKFLGAGLELQSSSNRFDRARSARNPSPRGLRASQNPAASASRLLPTIRFAARSRLSSSI
jgi:hypothetical protein